MATFDQLRIQIPSYTPSTAITDMHYLRVATEQLQYQLIHSPETYEISNEGLVSFTRKFIFGIANIFFHTANRIKTMFKSYRAFKQSELRFYKESKLPNYLYVMHMDFDEVRNTVVPIPRGMTKPYFESVTTLNRALSVLDMSKKVVAAEALVRQIHDSVLSQEGKQKITRQQVTNITSLFDERILKQHQKDVDKCYTNASTGTVRFDATFPNMDSFVGTGDLLLEMEAYLIGVSYVCETLEKMENLFQDIIDRSERNDIVIVKADMNTLSQITLLLATVFDAYGTWIDDLNRTTHNYVLCVKKLNADY